MNTEEEKNTHENDDLFAGAKPLFSHPIDSEEDDGAKAADDAKPLFGTVEEPATAEEIPVAGETPVAGNDAEPSPVETAGDSDVLEDISTEEEADEAMTPAAAPAAETCEHPPRGQSAPAAEENIEPAVDTPVSEPSPERPQVQEKEENIMEEEKIEMPPPPVRVEPSVLKTEPPPAPKRTMPERIVKHPISLRVDLKSATLGAMMKDARIQTECEIADVAAKTHIHAVYLESIENDDFGKLPSGVFPSAYVRKLCTFYNLDSRSRESAMEKVASFSMRHEDVPLKVVEEVGSTIRKNEEDETRIRRIFYAAVVAAAVLVLGIAAGIVMLVLPSPDKAPAQNVASAQTNRTEAAPAPAGVSVTKVDMQRVERLSAPRQPGMQELVIPVKRAR